MKRRVFVLSIILVLSITACTGKITGEVINKYNVGTKFYVTLKVGAKQRDLRVNVDTHYLVNVGQRCVFFESLSKGWIVESCE